MSDAATPKNNTARLLILGVLVMFMVFFAGFYIGRHQRQEQIISYPNSRYQPPEPTQMAPVDRLVNINTASREQLQTLDGIGPKLADRIIEFREHTPFLKPEDIQKVEGIGQSLFNQNKDRIIVKD